MVLNNYRDVGVQVQHDPYFYLLSQREKQYSRNLPFRFLFDATAVGGAALYFVTRHNELHRLRHLSLSLNLVFGLAWRMAFAALISDQVSRRLFVNAQKLKCHKMAEYEAKKIMVQWPNAKKLPMPHQKKTSFFLV
eukprot:403376486